MRPKSITRDPYLYIFLAFALYPFYPFLGNFTSLGSELLLFFIFTLSFNLCLGYTALPSFGHGALYGMGTFGAALTFLHLTPGLGIGPSILIGGLTGMLGATAVGWLIRDKKGIYFAMMTVAFSQVMFGICWRWDEVTGGESGLTGISRSTFLGMDISGSVPYYYLCFAFFVVCAILIRVIARSSFGMTLQSIRQNPVRATYLGYNTGFYKFLVYALSGFFAGLAGALYCFLAGAAFADIFDWTKSGDVVIATLLGGGTASFYGPIVGSLIFLVCKELISAFWENWLLAYGLFFVLIILICPRGLLGLITDKDHSCGISKEKRES
jgi:branched-chain amino acid transport system permease protein